MSCSSLFRRLLALLEGARIALGTFLLLTLMTPGVAFSATPEPKTVTELPAPAETMGPVSPVSPTIEAAPGEPVVIGGETLFRVSARMGSFSPAQRARAVEARIEAVARDPLAPTVTVRVVDAGEVSDLMIGDQVVFSVSEADAAAMKGTRAELASRLARVIESAANQVRGAYTLQALLLDAGLTVLATLILLLLLRFYRFLFPAVEQKLEAWRGTVIRSFRIQRLELLSADRFTDFLIGVTGLLRLVFLVVTFGAWATTVLSFFPWTRNYSHVFLGYLLVPIRSLWDAFLSDLPDLFFVLVIAVVTWYAIKLVRLIFVEIGKGTIVIPDFDPEWSEPTFKIARFLIIAFAAVVAFPYLPGSDSPAFRGISIFLGVLFSLGSSSAIANIVAGVVLTYTRAFRLGDRVKIADTIGDVIEKTLLVTRVRTIKNVEITIPNAMVLGSHIINFSASAMRDGLILNTAVTIGYDVPWRKVHELLIEAARETPGMLTSPAPFVLQTALDDFFVHYEINAYTDQPGRMAVIYSDLHARIQDAFNQAGVEIMSPHYASIRDGNAMAIPETNRPKDYQAPSFRFMPDSKPDVPRK